MNNIDEIIGDHLFQMNLILWLAQPIGMNIGLRAILAESGYSVYSISPSLALPIPIRERIREKNITAQDGCSPDIILIVSYVTKDDQKVLIKITCANLMAEIKSSGLRSNDTCCIGIKHDSDNSIYTNVDVDDSDRLNVIESGAIKVIEGQPDTDPRPLYFIPLDPSVEQNAYGKKTLEQRLLSEILSLIGRAIIPSSVALTVEDLLSKATWGMYSLWGDNNARKNLRRQVNSFFKNKIALVFPQNFMQGQDEWIFNLESLKDKESLLSFLLKMEGVEELSKDQLELFDGTDKQQ